MSKFTTNHRSRGELACRFLSEDARDYISQTSPIEIFEYDVDGKKFYAVGENTNTIYKQDLTFDQLDEYLCEEKRQWIVGEQYEDPEGIWEVIEVDGDEVTVHNIQEDNINEGKEFCVTYDEVMYYINGGK